MNNETNVLPTPELVAALANQYIERGGRALDTNADRHGLVTSIIQDSGLAFQGARLLQVAWAAIELAEKLEFPAPYETQVTMSDGRVLEPERHTITHFTDGEGFDTKDWAAISALAVGEAYIVQGQSATMTVRRVE